MEFCPRLQQNGKRTRTALFWAMTALTDDAQLCFAPPALSRILRHPITKRPLPAPHARIQPTAGLLLSSSLESFHPHSPRRPPCSGSQVCAHPCCSRPISSSTGAFLGPVSYRMPNYLTRSYNALKQTEQQSLSFKSGQLSENTF